jgi:hypothetical protein
VREEPDAKLVLDRLGELKWQMEVSSHSSSSIIHHPSSIIHHPSSIIHHPSSIIHHPSSITICHPASNITISTSRTVFLHSLIFFFLIQQQLVRYFKGRTLSEAEWQTLRTRVKKGYYVPNPTLEALGFQMIPWRGILQVLYILLIFCFAYFILFLYVCGFINITPARGKGISGIAGRKYASRPR